MSRNLAYHMVDTSDYIENASNEVISATLENRICYV